MRLIEFRINGLFGLFNHVIPFNVEERITIIHAPNGFGKTVILKLISSMFGGSLAAFRDTEFETIEFILDDGAILKVTQSVAHPELFNEKRRREHRRYKIELHRGSEVHAWNPDDDRHGGRPWEVPPSSWEHYVPHLERIAAREWRDRAYGDVISARELVARYGHLLPPEKRRNGPQPDWLDAVRQSLRCRIVETQRLLTFEKKPGPYNSGDTEMTLAVQKYSSELRAAFERILAESATLSQSLDQTFPTRLLERMRQPMTALTDEVIRSELEALEKQRLRLARVGLLDTAKDQTIIPGSEFEDATLRILTTYIEDARAKLAVFDEFLEKLELFLEIINSRFQYKSIYIDRTYGFRFKDIRKRPIEPQHLSSGEQHELVIIYELLFKTSVNTLVLLDEPEISLHIAWQRRFLNDLRRIVALTSIDAVVSTHSPQLIGQDLALTVQLQPPSDAIFISE